MYSSDDHVCQYIAGNKHDCTLVRIMLLNDFKSRMYGEALLNNDTVQEIHFVGCMKNNLNVNHEGLNLLMFAIENHPNLQSIVLNSFTSYGTTAFSMEFLDRFFEALSKRSNLKSLEIIATPDIPPNSFFHMLNNTHSLQRMKIFDSKFNYPFISNEFDNMAIQHIDISGLKLSSCSLEDLDIYNLDEHFMELIIQRMQNLKVLRINSKSLIHSVLIGRLLHVCQYITKLELECAFLDFENFLPLMNGIHQSSNLHELVFFGTCIFDHTSSEELERLLSEPTSMIRILSLNGHIKFEKDMTLVLTNIITSKVTELHLSQVHVTLKQSSLVDMFHPLVDDTGSLDRLQMESLSQTQFLELIKIIPRFRSLKVLNVSFQNDSYGGKAMMSKMTDAIQMNLYLEEFCFVNSTPIPETNQVYFEKIRWYCSRNKFIHKWLHGTFDEKNCLKKIPFVFAKSIDCEYSVEVIFKLLINMEWSIGNTSIS